MSSIKIFSEKHFYYDRINKGDVVINDTTVSLSNIRRFAGHLSHFYSVAQHAMFHSQLVPQGFAFEALMHDTTEAYYQDIPTPLKHLLPNYGRMEEKIDAVIREKYELPPVMNAPMKCADLIMLATEHRDLGLDDGSFWPVLEGIPITEMFKVIPLSPGHTYGMLMEHFRELIESWKSARTGSNSTVKEHIGNLLTYRYRLYYKLKNYWRATMSQSPSSSYDFLGYLIPGGFFILLMYFYGLTFNLDIVTNLSELFRGQSQIFGILNYASIVIISYIVGRFISITSAFFIERYMNKELGYPSKYLFKKLIDTSESIQSPSCDERSADKKTKIKNRIAKCVLCPIILWDFITQKLCYSQSLPFHLANTTWLAIKEGYEEEFITNRQLLQDRNGLNDDLFRLAYHYVYEFSKQHQTKIQNYVALYGFCRSICLIFIVSFWVSVLAFIYRLRTHSDHLYSLLSIMPSFFFVYVFYVSFAKFYRGYTLGVLVAFTALQSSNTIR